MKKILLTILAAIGAFGAAAQNVDALGISNVLVEKTDNGQMIVSMQFNPHDAGVKYNQQYEITPVIQAESGNASQELRPVVIAGRNAYYYTVRNDELQGADIYKASHNKVVTYHSAVPFEKWMTNSVLGFNVRKTGCCGAASEGVAFVPVADLNYAAPQFNAEYNYLEPSAVGSKVFNLEGKAYISFVVGKSVIDPNYMNNATELAKVTSTIDAVKDNKDAKVQKISLTGYASPEGAYAVNARLAQARTVAVKEYVRKLYAFPENLFVTNSVAEDWSGLRAAVEKSELLDKDKIIAFIDSDYPIEKRNDELRKLFPESYAFLLANVYPTLRHTDYVITYEVRKYTDVNEINQVLKTHPQNLSLNEFFLAANTYTPGTPEYNEVWDVAVRMYPQDPTANINAAQAAMSRGDLVSAEKFLSKVGDTPQSAYVKGLLAAKKGDYDKALTYFRKSSDKKAASAIDQVNKILNYGGAVTYRK